MKEASIILGTMVIAIVALPLASAGECPGPTFDFLQGTTITIPSTVSPGTADDYYYQWYLSTDNGATWTALPEATYPTRDEATLTTLGVTDGQIYKVLITSKTVSSCVDEDCVQINCPTPTCPLCPGTLCLDTTVWQGYLDADACPPIFTYTSANGLISPQFSYNWYIKRAASADTTYKSIGSDIPTSSTDEPTATLDLAEIDINCATETSVAYTLKFNITNVATKVELPGSSCTESLTIVCDPIASITDTGVVEV